MAKEAKTVIEVLMEKQEDIEKRVKRIENLIMEVSKYLREYKRAKEIEFIKSVYERYKKEGILNN